jgi:hypothetical protein
MTHDEYMSLRRICFFTCTQVLHIKKLLKVKGLIDEDQYDYENSIKDYR